jgi:anaerobic selenocysteine-containing dehydrogenase
LAAPHGARNNGRALIKTTTCYMCACRCGIRVHLDDHDSSIRYIDGNPAHPLNKGVICAKGASGIMKQRSPARLTHPMKRRPGPSAARASSSASPGMRLFQSSNPAWEPFDLRIRKSSRSSPGATRCRR